MPLEEICAKGLLREINENGISLIVYHMQFVVNSYKLKGNVTYLLKR